MRTAAAALSRLAAAAPPVDLVNLTSAAEMMARVDRKYLLDAAQLGRLIAGLGESISVLDIDGVRVFSYASRYFDTCDLATYRAHLQQRRRRYKVRLRSYLDTHTRYMEVKYKGPRQLTMKVREEISTSEAQAEAGMAEATAQRVLRRVYDIDLPGPLHATALVANRRATFLSAEDQSRFTVDVDLWLRGASGAGRMREELVLLETKSAGRPTRADTLLRMMGVRPTQISKYCAAIALTRTDVPTSPWRRLIRSHFETLDQPHCVPPDERADELIRTLAV